MDGQQPWAKIATGAIVTLGPLVAAAAGAGTDVPGWAPAALAGTAAAGIVLRSRSLRRPWSETTFQVTAGIAAGAWATWSTITGPWHLPNLIVGAAAAVLGVAVAPAFVGDDAPVNQQAAAESQAVVKMGRAEQWKARIEKHARVQPITILNEEDWPSGAGFTLHVAFAPESGDTWTAIRDVASRIAGAARLPKGCVITVGEGNLQGTAVVRIPTMYALADMVHLPDEIVERSIWDDFDIGCNEDTTQALVNLRQASGLIAGQRGGGKSNLLKVLIERVMQCRDSLVWVADLNGGGLAVPFMLPYALGEIDMPPIDWVAATPQEVVLMAKVAAAIAADRKARYAGLTAQAGGDLLPVTKDLPQITIFVDESAEVDDDPEAREAMKALLKVQRIGRADAVNVIFSALRATQDTVPVSVRKQSSLKLCGPVEDDTELEYMLPGSKVRSADLVHPGTFYLRRGDQGAAVRQIKVYRATPPRLQQTVKVTAVWQKTLDKAGEQVGGRVYAERMIRLQPWLARLAGKPILEGALVSMPVEPVSQPVDDDRREPASASERAVQRERARLGLRRVAADVHVREMSEDDLIAACRELVGTFDMPQSDSTGRTALDVTEWTPGLLIDIARESGADGVTPTNMLREIERRGIKPPSEKTLYKWLGRFTDQGKLRSEDGRYTLP
jgi:S-DNA-T family DNA segregation ATPase FtsK/SpoIIIE